MVKTKLSNTFDYEINAINRLTKTHWQLFASPINQMINYEAGQYLRLKYPNDQFLPFSIANAPNRNHQIELHIRAIPSDIDTKEFLRSVMILQKITICGPFGECQYQKKTGPLLLLAAGTGFAPAKAIIEHLTLHEKTKECHLYWTVREPGDFYLPKLPEIWKKQLDHFQFIPICTQPKSNLFHKNISMTVLNDFNSLATCQVYIFGPRDLAIDALKLFLEKGLEKNKFFADVLSRNEIESIV